MPKLAVMSLAALLLMDWSGSAKAQQPGGGAPASPTSDKHGEVRTGADSASGSGVAPNAPVTPPATAQATVATTPGSEVDPGTYSVRLRDLEQGVNELKEQIFRSKARLSLLAETVLQGVVGGAQARIVHENHIGDSYRIVKIAYALDGAPILNKADEAGALPNLQQFEVYNGSVVPGEHTLSVELELRGHGHGVFSYLRGYRFKITSNHTFTAAEGKLTSVRAVSYEQGGPTTPFEKRPAVHYAQSVAAPSPVREAVPGDK
jgi:hypothetical protein